MIIKKNGKYMRGYVNAYQLDTLNNIYIFLLGLNFAYTYTHIHLDKYIYIYTRIT